MNILPETYLVEKLAKGKTLTADERDFFVSFIYYVNWKNGKMSSRGDVTHPVDNQVMKTIFEMLLKMNSS